MPAILAILKKFFLGEFVKMLAWSLVYKGTEKAIKKGIKTAEAKGWTNGVDLDENALSELMLMLIKGQEIPENKKLLLKDAIVNLVYGKD